MQTQVEHEITEQTGGIRAAPARKVHSFWSNASPSLQPFRLYHLNLQPDQVLNIMT